MVISLVDRTGPAQDAVRKFTGMYQALAGHRRMTAEVLGEFYDDKRDRVYLLVTGLGTYALLRNEAGLHQMDRRRKERTPRTGREVMREDRELLRVEVHPVADQPSKSFQHQVKSKVAALKPVRTRLLKADLALTLFHEASVRSLEFWTKGPKAEALDRGRLILHSQITAGPPPPGHDTIIRQYEVGISPKVKDVRTGRTTTRIGQVFKGEFGPLLEIQASA
jgi:hypothetical protein